MMKNTYVKLLLTAVLFVPSMSYSQTRVCVLNDCRYPGNINDFLQLQQTGSRAGTDIVYNTVYYKNSTYNTIERYLFSHRERSVFKPRIENSQAAALVVGEAAERLRRKGYEPVVVTDNERIALWKAFKKTNAPQTASSFWNFVCSRYRANMLLALIESPFELEVRRRGEHKKGKGKTVEAEMHLSCTNLWKIHVPAQDGVARPFSTCGSVKVYWDEITRAQLRNGTYKKRTDVTFPVDSLFSSTVRREGAAAIFGKWAFTPVIRQAAHEAVEYIERNF